jgi:hypothetical protein
MPLRPRDAPLQILPHEQILLTLQKSFGKPQSLRRTRAQGAIALKCSVGIGPYPPLQYAVQEQTDIWQGWRVRPKPEQVAQTIVDASRTPCRRHRLRSIPAAGNSRREVASSGNNSRAISHYWITPVLLVGNRHG